MTARLHIVGFVADLAGSEAGLFEAAPVFQRGGDDATQYVADGLAWSIESAKKVTDEDKRYIHYLRLSEPVEIAEGQTVWLAGRTFMDFVRTSSFPAQQGAEMNGWATIASGYKWALGDRQRFHEFVVALSARLEHALHRALFDPLEFSHGDVGSIHAAYAVLPLRATATTLLNRALFHQEQRDLYSVGFIRRLATKVDRTHESAEEFDRQLAALTDDLRRPRLREAAPATGLPEALLGRKAFLSHYSATSESATRLANWVRLLEAKELLPHSTPFSEKAKQGS